MATDKQKLSDLLTEFGVPFSENGDEIVVTEADNNSKVTGYSGFYTSFEFNDDGSFQKMGAWE